MDPVPVGLVWPPVGGFGRLAGFVRMPLAAVLLLGGGLTRPVDGALDAGLEGPPVFGIGAGRAFGAPPVDGNAFFAEGAFFSPGFTAVFFSALLTGPSAANAPLTLSP